MTRARSTPTRTDVRTQATGRDWREVAAERSPDVERSLAALGRAVDEFEAKVERLADDPALLALLYAGEWDAPPTDEELVNLSLQVERERVQRERLAGKLLYGIAGDRFLALWRASGALVPQMSIEIERERATVGLPFMEPDEGSLARALRRLRVEFPLLEIPKP